MPFDSNGNASLVPGYFVQNGDDVLPSQHNPPLEDLASMLGQTLLRDGRAPLSGNLNANGNKVTNLAPPTNPNDAARLTDIPTGNGSSEILYDEASFILPTSTPLILLDLIPDDIRSIEIQGEVTNLSSGTNTTMLRFFVGDGSTWGSPVGSLKLAEWASGESNSRPFIAKVANLDEAEMSIYVDIRASLVISPVDNSVFIRPPYTGYVGTYGGRPITSLKFELLSDTAKNAAIRHLRIIGHR